MGRLEFIKPGSLFIFCGFQIIFKHYSFSLLLTLLKLLPLFHISFVKIWDPGVENLFVNLNFWGEISHFIIEFWMLCFHFSCLDGSLHMIWQLMVVFRFSPELWLSFVITFTGLSIWLWWSLLVKFLSVTFCFLILWAHRFLVTTKF
jgi:hypothetical protein